MDEQQSESTQSQSLLAALNELALDLRISWSHSREELWADLDPELWEMTGSPWVVLQTVSREAIRRASASRGFRAKVDSALRRKREIRESPAWFEKAHPGAPLRNIAYFSMEFMLSEALPIYSGGLGNVAGDQLRTASDLGVPVVGVGLLYQQGYFRQEIDRDGFQQAFFPFNDPGQLPIEPLRDASGEWLRVPLQLPHTKLWVRGWQAHVGRTRLYLLDTNDLANLPAHRGITSELYGGGPEVRLQQELVLGVGGWRLLRALGLNPEVCHLNEGHCAFLVMERALDYMQESGQPFDVALAVTRAGNVFTTHTPVEAGFDRFAPELMRQYFGEYAHHELRIGIDDLLALGRRNPGDDSEAFNMAYLAIRGSGAVNGVSQLHGEVSRRMFQVLFPRWPESEVPVSHVTNGVDAPTWDSEGADQLWTEACGEEHWLGTLETAEHLRKVKDEKLWEFRRESVRSLVQFVRRRRAWQLGRRGATREQVVAAEHCLNPDALTIGFARRFATYKRPNLLLHDRERLIRMLTNRQFPVQLVLAGKAHPQDSGGQAMIKEWQDFIARPEVRSSVVFLSDHDVTLTSHLVQGVDLWLNTPRRPWEACGTSGMKVLVNGGLNLSELDGWWAEAYAPDLGWALGDGKEHGDDPAWDAREAENLYDILEQEVIPAFYSRDERGVPRGWIAKMRESMVRLTPKFSSNRVLREYVEQYYLPAAAAYGNRAAGGCCVGVELTNWSRQLAQHWAEVQFLSVETKQEGGQYVFSAQVDLGKVPPVLVEVQLYAEARLGDGRPFLKRMQGSQSSNPASGIHEYSCRVPANRPANDYTPRMIAFEPRAAIPLEAPYIRWER
jgi:glycogen phosphorylase